MYVKYKVERSHNNVASNSMAFIYNIFCLTAEDCDLILELYFI